MLFSGDIECYNGDNKPRKAVTQAKKKEKKVALKGNWFVVSLFLQCKATTQIKK